MKYDFTIVFENGKELLITNADDCLTDVKTRDVEIVKNGKRIFINFDKVLYIGSTSDLN